ncbi:MAG: cupin domain-containing protein [Betaproteobacteria bacterium]|nr:cupin domain-containing protein [Betaproteobacteria bacterium]
MDHNQQSGPLGKDLGMRVQKSFVADTPLKPGRRPFFKYRDLGIEAATNGRMRAYHNSSIAGMTEPTGWHYHICEMQFVYVLKGSLAIEFEDGTVATFRAGDSFFVPGGVKHNEIYASEDKEALEVSVPGTIGTVNCERPAGLPEKLREVSGVKA